MTASFVFYFIFWGGGGGKNGGTMIPRERAKRERSTGVKEHHNLGRQ